jgi:hypothetical protein
LNKRSERPSVITFLHDHGLDNLQELQSGFTQRLKNLAAINPKIVSLELLYEALKESRRQAAVSAPIETFDLKSLAAKIYRQLAQKSVITAGIAGLGLFTLYKCVTSSHAPPATPGFRN